MTMNTKPQHALAEIGKAYSTAIIWVSRNRYTFATTDGKFTGHCSEPNPSKFRRALSLEIFCLRQKGYFTRIKHTTIEG
jgi:hypothetical protein